MAKYPTMTFVSRKVEATPGGFNLTGDLTFHGVTKPVTLAAKLEGKVTDGKGRTHLGYSATTTIDRRDWGLNWGKMNGGALIVGNEVTINFDRRGRLALAGGSGEARTRRIRRSESTSGTGSRRPG